MASIGSTELLLGCQSWTSPDWDGVFYPDSLEPAGRLRHYSERLEFVEIDSTFYASPSPSSVAKWYESTPPHFRFAAKLPQAITHDPDPKTKRPRRPLRADGWEARLDRFADAVRNLEEKLAAVVVQLPPQFHRGPEEMEALDGFLDALPNDMAWAIEFRHRKWLEDDVFDLLRARGVTLVCQDLYYMPRLVEVTNPELVYVRLQGRREDITRMNAMQIDRDEALDFWADTLLQLSTRGVRRLIVAANNHYQGYAPGTIAALQQRLGLA